MREQGALPRNRGRLDRLAPSRRRLARCRSSARRHATGAGGEMHFDARGRRCGSGKIAFSSLKTSILRRRARRRHLVSLRHSDRSRGPARARSGGTRDLARAASRYRRIHAMAGEPGSASGPASLPRHVDLLVRLQAVVPRLFDGVCHLDVERNAAGLGEARREGAADRRTLRFYDLVRGRAPEMSIDAAAKPIFAGLSTTARRPFLGQLALRVPVGLDHGVSQAGPIDADLGRSRCCEGCGGGKAWRMGVEVERNEPEPNASWHKAWRRPFGAARPTSIVISGSNFLAAAMPDSLPQL